MFRTLAQALEAINKRGIVHRDLKPQNILLCNPPQRVNPPIHEIVVKLADFGFARFLSDGVMAGTLCGSPMRVLTLYCINWTLFLGTWRLKLSCRSNTMPKLISGQLAQSCINVWPARRRLLRKHRKRWRIIMSGIEISNRQYPTIVLRIWQTCYWNFWKGMQRIELISVSCILEIFRKSITTHFLDDFFNHKFLHQSAMSSPSKRILEQQRLSPNHIRRVPSAEHHQELIPGHPQALHRVGSEQSYQINTNIANNLRPAVVTRAIPATYTSSPIRRRSENHPIPTRTPSRDMPSGTAPERHEYIYGTSSKQQPSPLRPQKSAPNNQMTDSGEFTFLPPLNQPASGSNTPRSSRQNSSNSQQPHENAVKQVQVHSSKTSITNLRNSSRAVPVPSQRSAFAKIEQERQNANGKDRPATSQEPVPSDLNFEDMRTNIEELNPPQSK